MAGEAQLRPIAGSRPRGADASSDAALEAELLADPKENAEHVMLVDLARNDLGTGRGRGIRHGRSLPRHRALQPHHAHRQRRQGPLGAGQGRIRSVRGHLSRRHAGGRAQSARDGDHRRAGTGGPRSCTAGRSAISADKATWTRRSPSARWCSAAIGTAIRPAAASSPTARRRPSTTRSWRRARCCAALSSIAAEGL